MFKDTCEIMTVLCIVFCANTTLFYKICIQYIEKFIHSTVFYIDFSVILIYI